ncbi:hypothetical protein N7457_005199 [Penicillium paradoxum]|uniref:uncharacterized protein n=1 Tax=Penicillium paradoxum TaxID=176176 RepID=UPI002547915D|nr:uncharacterized protein N7457_005199 [Penicillium paradoxum]KAJ5780039.1 hypothetical protein N7457_005199 [Penicillium paradoxum]
MSKWSWSSAANAVVHEYSRRPLSTPHNYSPLQQHQKLLITGPSDDGIGAEKGLCLASQPPSTIILAGRNRTRIQLVIEKITHTSLALKTVPIVLDLSDLPSVRAAANKINGYIDHIDVLASNAAVMSYPCSATKDGLEVQFGTNIFGPSLFTGFVSPQVS